MRLLNVFLFSLLLVACRPEQVATQYSLTKTPKIGEGKVFENKKNEAIEVSVEANDQSAKNLSFKVTKNLEHGELKNCIESSSTFSCEYLPNKDFVGEDSFAVKSIDGNLESTNDAKIRIIVRDFKSCENIKHNEKISRIMFLSSEVEYDEECQSEVQYNSCQDGEEKGWDKSYKFERCVQKNHLIV